MAELPEHLSKLLPSPSSRWVASATMAIAIGCVGLPELLQKLDLSPTGINTLLLQLSAIASVLFIGTLIILLLTINYANLLQTKIDSQQPIVVHIPKEPDIVNIDHNRESILKFIATGSRATREDIASSLGINMQLVLFNLEELRSYDFVTIAPYSIPNEWTLKQEGRRYLISRNLLSTPV